MSSHPKWWLRLETQNSCLEQVFVLMFLCDGFPFTSVPKATLPDPGLQPSSDYLALAWFLRCFWEDEATGRVGAVILLFGRSNWWIQWLWPSWNLAAILSFQDEEREKKEKEAEERRAKEAQKEAEERAKEAHQALLKHITIHTVLQSWCHVRHTVTCYLLSNHQTDLSLVQPCLLMECGTGCNTFLVPRQARKLEEARAKEEVWMWRLQVVVVVVAEPVAHTAMFGSYCILFCANYVCFGKWPDLPSPSKTVKPRGFTWYFRRRWVRQMPQ